MLEKYREISARNLALAYGNAWSIENMAAHGAEGRSTEYIGSTRSKHDQNIVTDYYRDSAGAYWYRNRAIVGGRIVSMETYIFGRDTTKARKYKRYS